jgi:hypothetical protein
MSSTPTDIYGLRRFRALKIFQLEKGAKDYNSEADERVENTSTQGVLFTD